MKTDFIKILRSDAQSSVPGVASREAWAEAIKLPWPPKLYAKAGKFVPPSLKLWRTLAGMCAVAYGEGCSAG